MNVKIAVLGAMLLLALTSCSMQGLFRPGQASYERGVVLFNQGNFRDAIPLFQDAIHEDPNFAQAYLYLGRSLLNLRRYREALQPLRAAYNLAPAETKQEIFNLLTDILFAAAFDGAASGSERIAPP